MRGARRLLPWIVGSAALAIGVGGIAVGLPGMLEPADEPVVLARPLPGEVRAGYLPDGTPVWVAGHEDGGVSVISAFSSHDPFGLNKLIWWCETADGFDDPSSGAKWDRYGVRLGGPAPIGLVTYETAVSGGQVAIGSPREGPPAGTRFTGPAETDREWCLGVDGSATWHTFDGWQVWNSPTAAIASEPAAWILLEGHLVEHGAEVRLCGVAGCADSVRVLNVAAPQQPGLEFGQFPGERFIARVRDGALDDLARVVVPPPEP